MLRRQRTILAILDNAGRRLSATQLQKLIFLLHKETFLGKDHAFYEFVPHKFGPYSFSAQREVEALVDYGYIAADQSSFGLTDLGKRTAAQADSDTSRAVRVIVGKYAKIPLNALLSDVYRRYPWYASRSELNELTPKTPAKVRSATPAVYTIGYEENSIDAFLDALLRAGIAQIIDVRANPVSRKYGFARSSLSNLAGKIGIAYLHCPELGIPSEKRRDVHTAAEFRELFGYYEREILPKKADDVARVAEIMKASPSVLICMEKEAVDCHRSRLAGRIAEATGLNIVHL